MQTHKYMKVGRINLVEQYTQLKIKIRRIVRNDGNKLKYLI